MSDDDELQLMELERERAMSARPKRIFTGKEERAAYDKELVDKMGTAERFLTGAGAGFSNITKNVGDIASPILPDALVPDKQKWAEERELVAPVTKTKAGGFGELVGEAAPLIPLAVGAEALLGAGGVATGISRVLPRAAKFAAKFGGGFAPGYIAAGPENRKTGGVVGGLLNAIPVAGRVAAGTLLGQLAADEENKTLGGVLGGGSALVAPWAYRGLVKPTTAAMSLMEKGVKDLTIDQMSPDNLLAGWERAGLGGRFKKALKKFREKPLESYRKVAVDESRGVGTPEGTEGLNPNASLAEAYRGFDQGYAPFKEAPVSPAGIRQAMMNAVDDPLIDASPQQVLDVQRLMAAQAGLLARAPGTQAHAQARLALTGTGGGDVIPIVPETVPGGAFMTARSNIREAAAARRAKQDYAGAQLLEKGEDVLTNRLKESLPRPLQNTLEAQDSQYALHKIVSDAVGRGGGKGMWRPRHLGAAVKANTPKGAYERGGGGGPGSLLREYANLGEEVLDAPTSVERFGRGTSTFGIPWRLATEGAARVANEPFIRKGLAGQYLPQRAVTAVADWLGGKGVTGGAQRAAALPSPGKMDSERYAQEARDAEAAVLRARIEALRQRGVTHGP